MTAAAEPAAYVVEGENMPRGEWLQKRRGGLGASDAPAVLSLSKYDGPLSCFASKVQDVDYDSDREPRFRRLGRELEPAMLRIARDELGAGECVHTPNTLFRSTTWEWMIATIDGYLTWPDGRKQWVEVKTGADAQDWANGVPDAVYAQNQHQLAVTGASEIIVALFFTGFAADYGITRVARDESYLQDVLLPAEEEFWWNHVVEKSDTGLEVDGNEYTRKALNALHPLLEDEPWAELMDEEWLYKCDELQALAERRKEIEKEEAKLKNEFLAKMGSSKKMLLADGRYFSRATIAAGTIERKEHTRFSGPYGGGV